ncbi:MAG: hypothetical protein J6P31_05210 [Oscillospiraceae bacterium]|nr:hypothetical protein [Oscillospiraceae bacterium]
MQPKYLAVLRWALNALLVLAAFLVESVCFGRDGVAGARLSLFPVAAVAVALCSGAAQGGMFCLIAGILYALTGTDMGTITLVAVTLVGTLAGGACQVYFRQHLLPALLFGALVLILSDGTIFALKLYLGIAHLSKLYTSVLPGMAMSLGSMLLAFPLSWKISRIGGEVYG